MELILTILHVMSINIPLLRDKVFLQQHSSYRMVAVGTFSGISSNKLYDYEYTCFG